MFTLYSCNLIPGQAHSQVISMQYEKLGMGLGTRLYMYTSLIMDLCTIILL
jgi:hypothetical protein